MTVGTVAGYPLEEPARRSVAAEPAAVTKARSGDRMPKLDELEAALAAIR